ncbi:hypothetical protein GCM10011380_08630 [Sphingomonas metalli]|uniref:Helix-turn-helix domain-containing protein n=1 Tax=Sphingomonas metalli TaxID=1779358 RepID=A0A916WQW8_9SPHN|nr:YdaS family helix-turn-helix protein [Sphingomonas metalli]GGB21341.1 hypothetical protein GCM10011380_08630 [Sphingomonas metalli]
MDVNRSPQNEALLEAVRIAGSQSALARLLKVTQRAVWRWVSEGKHLPAEHVLHVERETGVSRHVLRPDLYPLESESTVAEPAELPQ